MEPDYLYAYPIDESVIAYSVITLIILLALGTYFSAMEMAFSSINRARIKSLMEGGSKRAALVQRILDRFDEALSTLLICNNIVALTAATVSAVMFIRIFGEIGATISTIVITILVVVLSDIFPKSMAKEAPEKFALFGAPFLHMLMLVLHPINRGLNLLKNWLSGKIIEETPVDDEERSFREQELIYMVEEAEQEGAINEEDSQLIQSAIEFNELTAFDILTPRVNIVALAKTAGLDEMTALFLETGYSRIPVYEESVDNIIGVVHLRDFLQYMHADEKPSLEAIMSPAVYAAPATPMRALLKYLQQQKSHLAVVTDEYGGTEGIVTMEDILEQLVGDIYDETDEVIEEIVPLSEGKHKILCSADIDKMYEYFGLDGEAEASTVGGWIMDMLGKIPEEGDTFTHEHLTVTVTKADQRRAEECLVETVMGD